jgi:NAD(P)-dependent dehydrogenase (short-subunit alcohol dehydrogenase family)
MSKLTGKVALITGAKGGLGSFVTEEFLGAGATVVGSARSIAQSDFSQTGFIAMPADLTHGDAARALVESIVTRLGGVDILVHVMGGFAGGQRIEDTEDATWDRMMDLNARSAFNVTRAVAPHMRKAGSGRVIAIGARTALEPVATLGAYNASKAALVALIRTLALEGKDAGISANLILPGTMDTPANRAADPAADVSQWVRPQTVAGLALWLAADAGQEITGATIPVYGKAL